MNKDVGNYVTHHLTY